MTESTCRGWGAARSRWLALAVLPVIGAAVAAMAWLWLAPAALPPVPFPPQNPFSQPKRLLGKVLFFDEQLSMDNTMACATCHIPGNGGGDPRRARHPGFDGLLGTADDTFGSPGVVLTNAQGEYLSSPLFGVSPQVTPRGANSMIMAQYAPELFWDGRARSTFINPDTGLVSIPQGGALESQAVAPPLSDVEMAHIGRNWPEVIEKIRIARPLALATELPSDVDAGLLGNPSYPELFRRAFGTPEITAERVAFALATYQRTLVPDQTPWDLFQAGVGSALTPQQAQGLSTFNGPARCVACHPASLFTDNTFRNLGLRPLHEDQGRFLVTNNPADRGRFRVSSGTRGFAPRSCITGSLTACSTWVQFTPALGAPQFRPIRTADAADPDPSGSDQSLSISWPTRLLAVAAEQFRSIARPVHGSRGLHRRRSRDRRDEWSGPRLIARLRR